ncbi:anthranilate synthase component I [Emcibacter nanhaiensis]|uniref:Anthranilate synthase component 1 n=1 Tax=Emcibacter nanhaiensis TaxID=1505037 RepID=A0A501PRJ8_9PROT|nr:anthranilate synthase component I [Emcibacter nanhaiensis]TPD63073.1 anthranilate synthase component I [Emcibacter nanhaiensis]
MSVLPDFESFKAAYEAGKPQLVWSTHVADLETPVSAFVKLAGDEPFGSLLESVEGGAIRGRYTFIGLKPDIIWRCTGDTPEINRQALTRWDDDTAFAKLDKGSLDSLRDLFEESKMELPEGMPPSAAGLIGYMGYDMVRLMEKLPEPNPDPLGFPDSIFVRPTIMVVFDAVTDLLTIVTPVRPEQSVDAKTAYLRAEERLTAIEDALERPLQIPRQSLQQDLVLEEPTSNTGKERYFEMVEKAKEYIRAGDIFQVVLSQRFSCPFDLPPFALYRALRRTNPSPFLYYLKFGDFSVIGSSPEILVRLRDGEVTVRPIAGTRPRGKTALEDKKNAESLLNDPKELAEHLMLLDLGRNDVGRVSKVGTVEVTQQMIIEYYSHVMHIVSDVRGEISPEYDALKALAAGFPAGTVSGAPKVRAMEIIDELEVEKRGIYAGGVGYFSVDGSMDTCIVLRTAIVRDGMMYVQAGAGIVADSDPASEYAECQHKARALFRAAEEAINFAGQAERGQ